jgi:hypothetical protein
MINNSISPELKAWRDKYSMIYQLPSIDENSIPFLKEMFDKWNEGTLNRQDVVYAKDKINELQIKKISDEYIPNHLKPLYNPEAKKPKSKQSFLSGIMKNLNKPASGEVSPVQVNYQVTPAGNQMSGIRIKSKWKAIIRYTGKKAGDILNEADVFILDNTLQNMVNENFSLKSEQIRLEQEKREQTERFESFFLTDTDHQARSILRDMRMEPNPGEFETEEDRMLKKIKGTEN